MLIVTRIWYFKRKNFFVYEYCDIITKICIIEVYTLEYYFESHLICKWRYYRQIIFNLLNITVSYVDIIGLCHSVAILFEIYVMRPKCHVRWLRFHFKRIPITGLGQLFLVTLIIIRYFRFYIFFVVLWSQFFPYQSNMILIIYSE